MKITKDQFGIGSDRCMNEIIGDLENISEILFDNGYNSQGNTIRKAIALLKEQQRQIESMNFIYGFVYGGQVKEITELVRCKDCKWYDERISLCDNCGLPREQTFFCADGKHK